MSVPMKKPLTDIVVDGRKFVIPKTQKKAILSLIQGLSVNLDDPFKDLKKKFPQAAINLRGARFKEGLTQDELAKKIGTSPNLISLLENGRRSISLKMAEKLAKALNAASYKAFVSPKKNED